MLWRLGNLPGIGLGLLQCGVAAHSSTKIKRILKADKALAGQPIATYAPENDPRDLPERNTAEKMKVVPGNLSCACSRLVRNLLQAAASSL